MDPFAAPHGTPLQRYERASRRPLVAAAIAFVVAYALPVLLPAMPRMDADLLDLLGALLWALFLVDLGVRAVLSGRPGRWLLRHPIDVVLVLLPALRPLRELRGLTADAYTSGTRAAVGRALAAALVGVAYLMLVGAVAVLDAERSAASSHITSFGDALWWAAVTVTTVGYGDTYPVTVVGRLVAFALMLVGISLLGVLTASVAAWFVGRTREVENEVLVELRALRTEVADLRAAVDRASSAS
ncbi:potassium channel family protein [Longivirga aurantiaca]|uniref:Potassium channel family protein n=1 Tax=Longivirga aurantiaca TaxID=1837743 RepID=A0ABW1T2S0_9ACTN